MSRRVKKIKGGLNPRYVELIRNLNNPNNLKSLEELRNKELIDTDEYLLDNDKNKIDDPISKEPIKYENAILIDNDLFDVNELYNSVIINNNKKNPFTNLEISYLNILKIHLLIHKIDIKSIENQSASNNLKTLEELKILKIVNSNNDFVDEKGNIVRNFHGNSVNYIIAILINGFLYDVNELYEIVFNKNIFTYKKIDFKEEIINIEDTIKIYNLKENLFYLPSIEYYEKFFDTVKNRCKKIKDLIQIQFSNLENIQIHINVAYKYMIYISIINELRLKASIIFTNTLINVFKFLYKNQDNLDYLFKLIEDIDIMSYYTFQLVIAVGIKERHYSTNYLNDFERVLNEINKIIMISKEKSANILRIQKEINLYENELYVPNPRNMKKDRRKVLTDAYESIKKEHLDVLKNYFKSQENLFDIYRFCNSRFMNFANHLEKDNQVLVTKAQLLSQNIDKLYRKSNESFEKVKKTFEKYQDYKSPKFFQRVRRTFRDFSKKIGLPVQPSPKSPSLQTISPSIQVSPLSPYSP